jgi:D-glycero-D-manno-heptose 1,7-bisphosphate phosphatase
MPENRYVLLDRDGVINHDSDEFIKSPEQWLPIEGSLEAIAVLNEHGYSGCRHQAIGH